MYYSPYELSPIKNEKSLSQSIMIPTISRMMTKREKEKEETKMYHRMALDNFPFGKEGIKISEYVSSKMNSKDQEDNARILEEFRRKAVENKFHNKHGNVRNSKAINRYITESMMPGVTLNPSMVNCLEPELKSYEQQPTYHQSNIYLSQTPTRQYTQPVHNTIDNQMYNTRRKVSLPEPYYQQTISYPQNPEKQNSQCQTEVSDIKSYHELDLERKYYKLRCKYSKKASNSFDKVERMLHSLNKEIKENSKYLQNVILQNHNSICVIPKKGKSFSAKSNIYYEDKNTIKKPKTKIKTDIKEIQDEESELEVPDWKLNQEILYNSTHSSFSESNTGTYKKIKPQIDYTSNLKKNKKTLSNFFTPKLSRKHSRNSNYEMTRDYKIKDNGQEKPGIEKIREHLKLLKKHANRLDTINSHTLVH